MKITFWICLFGAVLESVMAARGQGAVTFDAHNNWIGTTYSYELGMAFRLVVPQGSGIDYFGITVGADNTPRDGTPFMQWFRQNNPSAYVELSLLNGGTFGLSSVWLADPTAPSPSPVSISFVGYLSGGSTVTNTFTTPGNGATTFASYTFNSDFSGGLTSVDILAPRWAMDNLVFNVPEPSAVALLVFACLVLAARRNRHHR